jgi:FXSXX-COOH protein
MDQAPPEYPSELVELVDVPLQDVLQLDESVLARSLRRVWHEADHPEEILAGWQSAI